MDIISKKAILKSQIITITLMQNLILILNKALIIFKIVAQLATIELLFMKVILLFIVLNTKYFPYYK